MTAYSAIAAMAHGQVIGKDNKMPWYLSEDLKHFKNTTMGHPVIMGRRTYLSLGRPLPGRENIVLTRNRKFCGDDITVHHSLGDVEQYLDANAKERAFVIGGGEIYRTFLHRIDTWYITRIDLLVEGDTHFPDIDWQDFTCVEKQSGTSEKAPHLSYTFEKYVRKSF